MILALLFNPASRELSSQQLLFIPLTGKFENPSVDIPCMRVGYRPAQLDQADSLFGSHPLGNQDARGHCHTTMPALRAVSVYNTSLFDHLQRFIHAHV